MSFDKENIEICNKAICAYVFFKRKKISKKENVSLVKNTNNK